MKNRISICKHTPFLDEFGVLANEDNKYCLAIKKRFLLKRGGHSLKRDIGSIQIQLFE